MPKFKGKVITRSVQQMLIINHLLASIIANHGEEKALEFTKGLVNNFARDPKGVIEIKSEQ
jgi:iron(III) transport system substrate-binding protein